MRKRNRNHLVVRSHEPRHAATISDIDAGENAVYKGDAHCGRTAVGLREEKRMRKDTSSGPQEKRCSCIAALHFFRFSEMKDSAEDTEE